MQDNRFSEVGVVAPDACARPVAPRPGGRSARVQGAVHAAVNALRRQGDELSIPAIAAKAGVTPSTIYRRWGTLAQLLSDVALQRMQPDQPWPDTGTLVHDLAAWLEIFVDEMTSEPGQAMVRDLVGGSSPANAAQCFATTQGHIERLFDRARLRGEVPPPIERLRDRVIAPVMYRILFTHTPPTVAEARDLLDGALGDR